MKPAIFQIMSNSEWLFVGLVVHMMSMKISSGWYIHVPSTTSATLIAAIKNVLIRCILPLSNCRGQSYDGAANIMGNLRGVARRIEKEKPSAIKVLF